MRNELQFALDELKNNIFCCPKEKQEQLQADIKQMQDLVNLATPKDVVYDTEIIGDHDAFGGTGVMEYGVCYCPTCDNYLDNDNHTDYCSMCGQALNWEVKEQLTYDEWKEKYDY